MLDYEENVGFNPWREAPPRATQHEKVAQFQAITGFQSLAGSPSTSHDGKQ